MTERASDDPHPRLYRALLRIRRVEEEVARIYPTDKVKSPVHLSIGQEAVSVAVCDALRADDVVFANYRGHAAYLAKGGDLKAMAAELYGKAGGAARGKAGSMHLIDVAAGFMGTSAIVATTVPQAVGYAYALKCRGEDRIVACFFGDGATEEGVFHESLNFAALKRVPILFVLENNLYAINSHVSARQAYRDVGAWVGAYGIPSERIEGNDTLAMREAAIEAAAAVRAGGGPRFLECMTYRWREHVGPGEDWRLGYRPEEEARPWIEGDQLTRLAGLVDATARKAIEAEVAAEIEAAFAYAEESPFPGDEELFHHVFRA